VPFKKRREAYHLPGGEHNGDDPLERLDPSLSVEEQGFVRRYLAYADSFLENAQRRARASRNDDAWLPIDREGKKKATA
jgi:hypothetical protein